MAFNDAAEFIEGAESAGEDDGDDLAPDRELQAEQRTRSHRPKRGRKPSRGRGYGYRRKDE